MTRDLFQVRDRALLDGMLRYSEERDGKTLLTIVQTGFENQTIATISKAAGAASSGAVIAPPFSTSVGRTAVLSDPQGATFSVSKVGPIPTVE